MNKKGFTFTELLITMVFFGIMILIIFPSITNLGKQSEDNKYKAFLSDVYLATEAYVQKYIDNYPNLQQTDGKAYIYMSNLVNAKFLKSTLVNPNYCDNDNNCGAKKISTCDENGVNCVIDDYTIIVTKTEDGTYSYELVNEILVDEYKQIILNGAYPKLSDNLVPITIESNGLVKKASINSKWYNYEKKEWANAVILKDSYDKLSDDGKVYGATKQSDYVYFDGQDDYINLGLENYDFGNNVSIAIKVLFKSDAQQTFFNNYESGGIGFKIYNDKKLHFQIYNSELGTYSQVEGPVIELNKDYTIVGTYNGTTLSLFINGSFYKSIESVGKVGVSEMPITIGTNLNSSGNTYYSNINVYETAIYNKVLTEEEIKNNFADDIKIYNDDNLVLYENFTNKYTEYEIILEDNIESYFVWIPKYKYRIFDLGLYSSTTTGKPTEPSIAKIIDIVFGIDNTSDSNDGECTTPLLSGESGNCGLNDYMTHPAFITMNTTGLWVGKFETGYNGVTSSSTTDMNSNDSSKVIVKPNVYSWRGNNLSNMFIIAYNYNRTLNSHMMKNTEWGAVAYLSHSIYGIGKEININNNSDYLTGYSAVEGTAQSLYPGEYGISDDVTRAYNTTTGYKASTTGNITGIYDMSGGAHEYMASYIDGLYGSSGFDAISIAAYDSKYFDIYSSTSTTTSYNNRILGDSTGEMGPFYDYQDNDGSTRKHNNWYSDFSHFADSTYPWFSRGGYYNWGVLAGQFYFRRITGDSRDYAGSRLVLIG